MVLLSGLFAISWPAQAQGNCGISGLINVDSTFSPTECDPYIVTGNAIVSDGVTLTIEPGTTLKFESERGLTVEGTLIAQGTADNQITFTSAAANPAPGDWGQIYFERPSPPATFDAQGNYTGGNVLQHVVIEYGGSNNWRDVAVDASFGTSFYLDQSIIRRNAAGVGNPSRVTNCEFYDNNGLALYASSDELVIINSDIYDNGAGSYGNTMDVSGLSLLRVQGNTIQNNSGKVAVRSADDTYITNNDIINNRGSRKSGLDISVHTASEEHIVFVLDNNVQNNYGFGISLDIRGEATTTAIIGNEVSGNTGTDNNGGISAVLSGYDGTSSLIVRNNTISNNTAGEGGGIWVNSLNAEKTILITQNTFRRNHATDPNGGGALAIGGYNNSSRFTANELIENTATDPGNFSQRVPQDIYTFAASNNNPFNAQGNIWGTDDRSQIQSRIYDGSDDAGLAFVDFENFRLEGITSERSYDPGVAGTQDSADNKVTMTIPGSAITEPTTVTHRILTEPTIVLPTNSTFRYGFDISTLTASDDNLSRFATPITLVIDVPTMQAQASDTNLNVAYRDGLSWTNLLPCDGCSVIDTQVTLVTDRLGEFALVESADISTVYLPLIVN
jgi:hypothetical protein